MRQPSTTPVPNVILDSYLKDLSSAELKVLLVVIRQTLGWADLKTKDGRKESDWISTSQLQQKTGSSHRAITSAIDLLVKKKIIQIHDQQGNLLDQPGLRRGKTKLFYRLNSRVDNDGHNKVEKLSTNAKFAEDFSKKVTELVQKMRITKETLQN
ncbi:MAG: replication protein [Lentimicrobiaceae bacterium]|nr:replication protein [Lentimicrobiaceae bacterium]